MNKSASKGNGATSPDNEQSRALRESERIKELRSRLYARGPEKSSVRHALPKHEIHEEFPVPKEPVFLPKVEVPIPTPEVPTTENAPTDAVLYSESMTSKGKRKTFRTMFVLLGGLFFLAALAISSFLMLKGGNTISGENISIEVTGPIAVAGGDEVPFKVTVANQNAVAIQSATLIIEYPKGTQSATEVNKEIGIVRQPLDTIGTGELVNIPLKARVFGEENQEKEIKVSIDYRIQGSNATFHKEATPLRFKLSTSPVVMTFDAVKSISSGQEATLALTIQSNSPTTLTDILVRAEYPDGFDFSESSPETQSGEDVWKFSVLKPNEKKVITIKGLMTGYEDEARQFNATAGVANESNSNVIASQLATARTEIVIEQPFLDANITINGNAKETVVMSSNETANVGIKFANNLDFAIYDGKVEVVLSGNALDDFEVKASDGFYDSSKNTITWDGVDENSLKEILPGRSANLSFSLRPLEGAGRTPEMKFKVTVRGKRIFEDQVSQELVGTAERTLKVESIPTLVGEILYSDGPFTNTGPLPPVAEKVTQYTYLLKAKSGANDITGAELTAVLPLYVSWLDLVSAGDSVSYNTVTRALKWNIGDMDANTEVEVAIQVSFLPSLSQVNTSPTLLESQRFKATDRFTGTVVRVEHPALTTTLYGEDDKKLRSGTVRQSE
ncbi:MAG: hypothetical protein WAW13_04480 [Minisyncoccia bacterium]